LKKPVYILLLIILFIQAGGLLFVLKVEQSIIQFKMSERLENSNSVFEKFTLSKSDYENSLINSDEILLNGNMYDIKSAELKGDSVELQALCDLEEEDILEDIKNLIKSTRLPIKDLPYKFQKLISLIYITPFSDSKLFIPSIDIFISGQFIPDTVSRNTSIFIPPPERG
jgi:hypothetical protein